MSVSPVSSSGGAPQSTAPARAASPERQLQKESALGNAPKSDEAGGAKSAASALQQNIQNAPPAQVGADRGQNQIRDAVKAVDQALKSSTLASAKAAFSVQQQGQQQKVDQKNSEITRQAIAAPSAASALSGSPSALGRRIDTTA